MSDPVIRSRVQSLLDQLVLKLQIDCLKPNGLWISVNDGIRSFLLFEFGIRLMHEIMLFCD